MSNIADMVYPECAIRQEYFPTEAAAVDCGRKTAMVGAIALTVVVTLGIIVYLTFGGTPTTTMWLIAFGALALAAGGVLTSDFFASRSWRANEAKIAGIMATGKDRVAAVEELVQQNDRARALRAQERMANAQSNMSNAMLANTGMNVYNTFKQ